MYKIEDLHQVHLEIADEIHQICNKNNIEYSLNGGTLLGAIRHKGFIPWDDDFDIGMTRDNYNLFMEAILTDLSDDFYFMSMHNDDLYSLPFMKIMKKNSMLRESTLPDAMEGYGIFVDVFPYDNVPDTNLKRLFHQVSTDFYFRLLLAKSKYNLGLRKHSVKNMVYLFFKIFARMIPRNLIVKRLEKNSIRYQDEETENLTIIGGSYGYKKETISRKLFQSLSLVEFEKTQYYAFSDYEEILKGLYGDYMKYPPKEERYNRHSYEFVEFDLTKVTKG